MGKIPIWKPNIIVKLQPLKNYKNLLLMVFPLSHIQRVRKNLKELQQKFKKKNGAGSRVLVGMLVDLEVKEKIILGEYDSNPTLLEKLGEEENKKDYLAFNWNGGKLECKVDKNRYSCLPTKFQSDFIISIAFFHGLKDEFYISKRGGNWYIIIKDAFTSDETFMVGLGKWMEKERENQNTTRKLYNKFKPNL